MNIIEFISHPWHWSISGASGGDVFTDLPWEKVWYLN